MNLYADINDYCCRWTRNLVSNQHIGAGEVVKCDIRNLDERDTDGYDRVHLFNGISGWELALNLAGWPNLKTLTGSCPCQGFSVAGKRKGFNDERDLWPEMFRIIKLFKPFAIFGEQVASSIGFGWADRVQENLEDQGYSTGFAVLGSHCVGAPHIRKRLYWVAYSNQDAGGGESERFSEKKRKALQEPNPVRSVAGGNVVVGVAMGNSNNERLEGREAVKLRESPRQFIARATSPWNQTRIATCPDGFRRIGIESGVHPLAPRVSNRMEQLSAYGNAITPQVAAIFIKAFMQEIGIG